MHRLLRIRTTINTDPSIDGYFPACRKVLGGGHVDLIFLQQTKGRPLSALLASKLTSPTVREVTQMRQAQLLCAEVRPRVLIS